MCTDDEPRVTLTLTRREASYALAAPAMRRALEDTDEMLRREAKYGTDEAKAAFADEMRQGFLAACRDNGIYLWDDTSTVEVPSPSWWKRLLRRLS